MKPRSSTIQRRVKRSTNGLNKWCTDHTDCRSQQGRSTGYHRRVVCYVCQLSRRIRTCYIIWKLFISGSLSDVEN